MKQSKVAEAYKRCEQARKALSEIGGRCMEVTEDKAGILWERWLVQTNHPTSAQPSFVNVVVFATPSWWDVFVPLCNEPEIAKVVAAIKALRNESLAESAARELAA